MVPTDDQIKATLALSIEVVLMRRGGPEYHLVLAKLRSLYNCEIIDCYENPECLRNVFKEVYGGKYDSLIDEIKVELGETANEKKIVEFFAVLGS